MKMKFFIVVFYCMSAIEIKTSATQSGSVSCSAMSAAAFSVSQTFDESDLVSEVSDTDPLGSFPRGSLLEQQIFFRKNQEKIDFHNSKLALLQLNLETALQKVDSKLLEIDQVKQKMDSKLAEIDLLKKEFVEYIQNIDAMIDKIQNQGLKNLYHIDNLEQKVVTEAYNFNVLRSEFRRLYKRIDETEQTKVSAQTLTSDSLFMNEVESMLATLLVEKFLRHPMPTYVDDEGEQLPSGRASTCSFHSMDLSDEEIIYEHDK